MNLNAKRTISSLVAFIMLLVFMVLINVVGVYACISSDNGGNNACSNVKDNVCSDVGNNINFNFNAGGGMGGNTNNRTISGTVTLDGASASGVTVLLKNSRGTTSATATTDQNGSYSFSASSLSSGTYTISVEETDAYNGGSVTVTYSRSSVTAGTIALTSKASYTVHFRTDIKDYKAEFVVTNSSGTAVAEFTSDTDVVDKEEYGDEAYRLSALNKYYDLPAGTYYISYSSDNYTPVINGTELQYGSTMSFKVPDVLLLDIKLQPKDELEVNVNKNNLNGVLPMGTTSLNNLSVSGENSYSTTGLYSVTTYDTEGSTGVVAATSPDDDSYVMFAIDGTYNVSIFTAMQAGALYPYSDGATINGSTTPVALDSNFRNYTLVLTAGTYIIKGAAASGSATQVRSITLYDYSVLEMVEAVAINTDDGNNGVVVTAQLKKTAINAGVRPENFSTGELGVVFAKATEDNLAILQNVVSLNEALDENALYYVTIDNAMYEKVLIDEELVCGDDDESTIEYFHGFNIENVTDSFYVMAMVNDYEQWNPDSKIIKVDVDGTCTVIS